MEKEKVKNVRGQNNTNIFIANFRLYFIYYQSRDTVQFTLTYYYS